MSEVTTIDYDELRERFPWAGLVDDETLPAAAEHRDVMARAHLDRAALDALDAARRHSA